MDNNSYNNNAMLRLNILKLAPIRSLQFTKYLKKKHFVSEESIICPYKPRISVDMLYMYILATCDHVWFDFIICDANLPNKIRKFW